MNNEKAFDRSIVKSLGEVENVGAARKNVEKMVDDIMNTEARKLIN